MKTMTRLLMALLVAALILHMSASTAATELEKKIDSLFVIASSGEVRYRDLTEPAMDSIAALGEAAVPHMIEKFTTKDARERWTIIWVLQRIGSPAVPYLVDALQKPDDLVVSRVAWALGDIGDTSAVPALIAVTRHRSWQVREESVGALGQLKDNRADDAVVAALSDTIGQVRKAAVVSAGHLKLHESVPQIVHRFGDSFFGARLAAVDAIIVLDTAIAVQALTDSLDSADPLVSDLSARALGALATDRAFEALARQATGAADPNRRVAAAVALILGDPKNLCGYHTPVLAAQTDRLDSLKVTSALHTAQNGQKEPSQ